MTTSGDGPRASSRSWDQALLLSILTNRSLPERSCPPRSFTESPRIIFPGYRTRDCCSSSCHRPASPLPWVKKKVLADTPEPRESCRACAGETPRVRIDRGERTPGQAASEARAPQALRPRRLPARAQQSVLEVRHGEHP